MKIFHRYAKQKVLRPTKGDLINELQLYNTMGTFGTMVNDWNDADICYVRANPNVFRQCKSPKIYFGVPYHHLSFKRADAIAVFSDEWKRRLLAREEVAGCPGIKVKKVIVIDQPVAPMFKPLQDHPRTKMFRKQLGGGFIIGHFGKMRHNRSPYALMSMLPELKKEYPQINVVYSDVSGLKSPHINKRGPFDYKDMPYVLSACDMLYMGSWGYSGDFSGALRTKEGMACGVNHILPKWKARVEEFGKDYPYYHDWKRVANGKYPGRIRKQIRNAISLAIEDPGLRMKTGLEMIKRAKRYSVEASAKKMKKDFEALL